MSNAINPHLLITTGGAANKLGARLQHERLFTLIKRNQLKGERQELFKKVYPSIYLHLPLDSAEETEYSFEPEFANQEPLKLRLPNHYQPFETYSGSYILENLAVGQPFHYLKEFIDGIGHEHIKDKNFNREAEGNPLYGLLNALTNKELFFDQISEYISKAKSVAPHSNVWGQLAGIMSVKPNPLYIDIISSTAGGQGSGLIVAVLALVADAIYKFRNQVVVHLHIITPGFHACAEENGERQDQWLRTLGVLNSIMALKAGTAMTIPTPYELKYISPSKASSIYDYFSLHLCNNTGERSNDAFIHRLAVSIAKSECSEFAYDRRQSLANALELARNQVNLLSRKDDVASSYTS